MTVPTLLVDFPPLGHPDHSARATLLGHQWPVMWVVGNNFFRPISTLGIFGYGFAAWAARGGGLKGDWRLYALGAACHLSTVVHSAINMQPLNDQLDRLSMSEDKTKAVQLARDWVKCNKWRIFFPFVAGSAALWQACLV